VLQQGFHDDDLVFAGMGEEMAPPVAEVDDARPEVTSGVLYVPGAEIDTFDRNEALVPQPSYKATRAATDVDDPSAPL